MDATSMGEGSVTIRFSEDEAELLRRLLEEMETLLASRSDRDPVVGRLFPPAYEKRKEEESYRSLVGDELISAKKANLRTAGDMLGPEGAAEAALSEEQAEAWLALLTDLRLALGTRLDVTEEKMSEDIDPDDPEAAALSVLHWLGWVQGTILEAIT
jgi:Domain of unknown function (DUF2017)